MSVDGIAMIRAYRALYRQFEDSLNDQQQFELAYALHKRA